MPKKSWKTTAAGFVAAIGVWMTQQNLVDDPAWIAHVGQYVAMLGSVLTGFFARDKDVSSEQQNASK